MSKTKQPNRRHLYHVKFGHLGGDYVLASSYGEAVETITNFYNEPLIKSVEQLAVEADKKQLETKFHIATPLTDVHEGEETE